MLAWLVPELSFSPRIKRRVGFRGNPEEIEFAGTGFPIRTSGMTEEEFCNSLASGWFWRTRGGERDQKQLPLSVLQGLMHFVVGVIFDKRNATHYTLP